jgi:hypothetical protein
MYMRQLGEQGMRLESSLAEKRPGTSLTISTLGRRTSSCSSPFAQQHPNQLPGHTIHSTESSLNCAFRAKSFLGYSAAQIFLFSPLPSISQSGLEMFIGGALLFFSLRQGLAV